MKRILLDTNIYGTIVEDQTVLLELPSLIPTAFVVYGMPLIRKELRQISTKVTVEGRSKRAYNAVNQEKQFRTPEFYVYEKFKELVRRIANVHSASSNE